VKNEYTRKKKISHFYQAFQKQLSVNRFFLSRTTGRKVIRF